MLDRLLFKQCDVIIMDSCDVTNVNIELCRFVFKPCIGNDI